MNITTTLLPAIGRLRLQRCYGTLFLGMLYCAVVPVFLNGEDVRRGERVHLRVEADGSPTPSFIWYHNGKEVSRGADFIIESFTADHAGKYVVRAENHLGFAESPVFELILISPPPIPAPPVISDVKAITTTSEAP